MIVAKYIVQSRAILTAVCKVTLHELMLTFNGSSIQGSSRFGGSNHPKPNLKHGNVPQYL